MASALVCATAAALVELTATLAAQRIGAEGAARTEAAIRLDALAGRAAELRESMLAAADDDARAYADATAAEAADRPAALAQASEPPLAIAECAAEVAEAAAETAQAGAWDFRADAIVAGELAAAASRSGAELVAANLAANPDDPRLARVRAAADRAWSASRPATDPPPAAR